MKKLVKLININDAKEKGFQNGDWMHVETYPRTEKIISAFLSQGWELSSRTQRYRPAVQKEGNFAFYLDGWDLLFEKEVDDDVEDDGDKILTDVLSEVAENAGFNHGSDEEELDLCDYGDFDEDELEFCEDENVDEN